MARNFNGSTDKIAVDSAHSWSNLANWSLSAWFKTSSANTNREIYIEQGTTHFVVLGIASTSTKLRFTVDGTDTSGYRVFSSGTVNDDAWHHACWTQDSSGNFALYLDGTIQGSGTATPPSFTPSTADIGNSTGGSNGWTGSLAHVATWGRKLSVKEITSLANGLLPSHLGPTHYWPLWGEDSPEADIGTGTKVTGTLTGTAAANSGRADHRLLVLT